MNLHTPERHPKESQADYRARQARSKAAIRTMRRGPTQAPAISPMDTSRFFLGQHTNPEKNKQREAKRHMGARQWKRAVKHARLSAGA